MLDHIVLIPLRMDEHLFLPQLILETQLVEALPLVLWGLSFVRS